MQSLCSFRRAEENMSRIGSHLIYQLQPKLICTSCIKNLTERGYNPPPILQGPFQKIRKIEVRGGGKKKKFNWSKWEEEEKKQSYKSYWVSWGGRGIVCLLFSISDCINLYELNCARSWRILRLAEGAPRRRYHSQQHQWTASQVNLATTTILII